MLFLMIVLMVVGVAIAVVPLAVTIAKTSGTAGGADMSQFAATPELAVEDAEERAA